MDASKQVYLHVWSGDHDEGRRVARQKYPDSQILELSHQELRSRGWRGQIRALRALHGRAVVFFFAALDDTPQLQLVLWSGLIHRCTETAIADARGSFRVYTRKNLLHLAPRTIASVVCDIAVLVIARIALALWLPLARPRPSSGKTADLDVAYLFPYPLVRDIAGGAMSHIRGVLSGLKASNASCEVYSAVPLPVDGFSIHEITCQRRLFIFWESTMLTYGVAFARQVKKLIKRRRVAMLYQRHGRFTIAGALLSQWTGIPLVLEYNGSEKWMAAYWDPTRFYSWMKLCEDFALRCASLIVVVSDPIKGELTERGIPADRVVVSPNAVDPDQFHPKCGGEDLRRELGIDESEMVVTFVGSFGPWHGVTVLRQTIAELCRNTTSVPTRFLLVGNGPLQEETRKFLQEFERTGQVVFTGMIPHDQVRPYLDAADILVSPHVPLPDGKPFFGSPTKLFEYMAMGKAIVASDLDQLAQVLTHMRTAFLVTPGSEIELAHAIRFLASQPLLRQELGNAARQVAIERHTWKQNVIPLLAFARQGCKSDSSPVSSPITRSVTDSGLR